MIKSEEGGASKFIQNYISFPPCPRCKNRGMVGVNPMKRSTDPGTENIPDWYCYGCCFPFEPKVVMKHFTLLPGGRLV